MKEKTSLGMRIAFVTITALSASCQSSAAITFRDDRAQGPTFLSSEKDIRDKITSSMSLWNSLKRAFETRRMPSKDRNRLAAYNGASEIDQCHVGMYRVKCRYLFEGPRLVNDYGRSFLFIPRFDYLSNIYLLDDFVKRSAAPMPFVALLGRYPIPTVDDSDSMKDYDYSAQSLYLLNRELLDDVSNETIKAWLAFWQAAANADEDLNCSKICARTIRVTHEGGLHSVQYCSVKSHDRIGGRLAKFVFLKCIPVIVYDKTDVYVLVHRFDRFCLQCKILSPTEIEFERLAAGASIKVTCTTGSDKTNAELIVKVLTSPPFLLNVTDSVDFPRMFRLDRQREVSNVIPGRPRELVTINVFSFRNEKADAYSVNITLALFVSAQNPEGLDEYNGPKPAEREAYLRQMSEQISASGSCHL